MKITATNNFADTKVELKEQVVNTSAVSTGTREGTVTTNKNDTFGDGGNDAQSEKKRIISLINDTNNKLKAIRRRCEYTYNDDVNIISIKVIDFETDKVIKEIPPEEALDAIQKIWEVAGLLVDEKI